MVFLKERRLSILSKINLSMLLVAVMFLSAPVNADDENDASTHSGDHQMGGHKMGMQKMDEMKKQHMQKNSSVNKSITPEIKKHLAEMYSKMGVCVGTEMSLEDCQKQVMKDCPVVKELGYCPLMEGIAPLNNSGGMKNMPMGDM